MIKKLSLLILLILLIVAGVVLVKTLQFSKEIAKKTSSPIPAIPDSAIAHLQAAVRIPTIGFGDGLPVDTIQFNAFWQFVEQHYPLIHQNLSYRVFNGLSRLYTWPGKHPEQKPYVLMAHFDVVPIEPATANQWTVAPFGGELKNDTVYGRGVTDDKSSLISILEATEKLLSQHFQPERTIYFSFGNDEETIGQGAQAIAKYMQEQKIHPEMVLDEGGEITREHFTELNRPIALISIAEKGYMTYELSVDLKGGHSSTPAKETAIDVLLKGLVHLREKQMPYKVMPVLTEMLQTIGPGLPFTQRMAIANPWLFERLLVSEFEKDKDANALFHTTIVPTIIQAGIKDNVIPSIAKATVNTRILPGETADDVEYFMRKQMNDERIQIRRVSQPDYNGPPASKASTGYRLVENATYQVMKDVIPVPFLSVGATDSKYFQPFADAVIKFLPSTDSKGFHGIDERLPVDDYKRMIFFYQLIITGVGK
jgi:carboxypeptidase PM20D1